MIARRSVLLLPLMAAGCGDDDVAQRTFAMPNYSYLAPIRLNVASIEIDASVPNAGDSSLAQLSPLRLSDGLKEIANDRLVAAGSAGRALFAIDRATLQRIAGGIEGMLAVRLDVFAGQGTERAGFAEARVARRRTSSDVSEDSRAVLYDFTTQLLNDMNVELEYQVKRSLKDWLQPGSATAPLPAAVQTEPLSPPARPTSTLRLR